MIGIENFKHLIDSWEIEILEHKDKEIINYKWDKVIRNRIRVNIKIAKSYTPSIDWYKWELLCAFYEDEVEDIGTWITNFIVYKCQWYWQDVKAIEKDYILTKKNEN